jgi:hypothetical protein
MVRRDLHKISPRSWENFPPSVIFFNEGAHGPQATMGCKNYFLLHRLRSPYTKGVLALKMDLGGKNYFGIILEENFPVRKISEKDFRVEKFPEIIRLKFSPTAHVCPTWRQQ